MEKIKDERTRLSLKSITSIDGVFQIYFFYRLAWLWLSGFGYLAIAF